MSQEQPQFRTATVIGAGTMGAAIAAHLANAGLTVHLLDMAPTSLTADEAQAGLTLDAPSVRNRLVQAGYNRMISARPANLFATGIAARIHLGNLSDDLAAAAANSDWIIEAIVEQAGPKQALMAQLEQLAAPDAIISTNTSGIPIHVISAGRSRDFQRRFLGAHFFNPPRYLPLLELIPTPMTDPAISAQLRAFVEEGLGKGVVICKDTPNFIANRMVSYILADLIGYAVTEGYTVEEVDALTGPLLGRPRSGTFRLNDVVGIDIWAMIARNLHSLIPNDADRAALIAPAYLNVMDTLIAQGHLGTKTGQGFYKTVTEAPGGKEFWGLDLQVAAQRNQLVYLPPQQPGWPSVEKARRLPLAERLRQLVVAEDRAGQLIWHTLAHTLAYAAQRIPEIADSLLDIDRALEWGYAWELGPFALWDALGVRATTARMAAAGIPIAPWVEAMLAQGYTSFYSTAEDTAQDTAGNTTDNRRQVYDPQRGDYVPIASDPRTITIAKLQQRQPPLAQNEAASLHNLGDGVLLLEFHTKANALDLTLVPVLDAALDQLHGNATGLVIGNEGVHFSAGANLRAMLTAAQAGDWAALEALIRTGQARLMALRVAPKPVVAAPFQRVLGGGLEVCLASHRVVAHAETYMGLVEMNVGLVPGWGGCKEMVRRHVQAPEQPNDPLNDPLLGLRHVFDLITRATVSGSAREAQDLGLLAAQDRVVMHRDHLLHVARQTVLELAPSHQPPAVQGTVYRAGKAGQAMLYAEIEQRQAQGQFTEHEVTIATALALVLCGLEQGNSEQGSDQVGWADEQHFLELEAQTFLRLLATSPTQARIRHLLEQGKPLRN